MFGVLEDIGRQVVSHSTGLGQVWYLLVFVFRLGIVTTVGSSVYGDEQGAFMCSERVVGCTNMCYNQFAKISHIRFWAFQVVAVSTPTLLFHLYVKYVTTQIRKLEIANKAIESIEDKDSENCLDAFDNQTKKEISHMERRKRALGRYKMKEVVRGDSIVIVPQNRKIQIANLINLLIRLTIEIVFIFFGASLFNIKDGRRQPALSFSEYAWMKVPGYYKCNDEDAETKFACHMHLQDDGTVPCWVSRPYEKTVLLRYMNIASIVCVFITAFEIFSLFRRMFRHKQNGNKANLTKQPDYAFNPTNFFSGRKPNDYVQPPLIYYPTKDTKRSASIELTDMNEINKKKKQSKRQQKDNKSYYSSDSNCYDDECSI